MSIKKIAIRRALQSDTESIHDLFRLVYPGPEHDTFVKVKLAGSFSDISKLNMCVAIIDGSVVGTASVQDGVMEHVMVHPEHRRSRVATMMFVWIKPDGNMRLTLMSTNDAAIKFYTRMGMIKNLVSHHTGRDGKEYSLVQYTY